MITMTAPSSVRNGQQEKAESETDSLLAKKDASPYEPFSIARRWPWMMAVGVMVVILVVTTIFSQPSLHHKVVKIRSSRPASQSVSSDSLYNATQFISFTINTFGGMAEHGECQGRDYSNETGTCYLGNQKNLTEDVEHRLSILLEVLDTLKADVHSSEPKIDHRDDVLKIFMLPEFYLRGPNGAYNISELFGDGLLLEVADRIHDYIAVDEFSHYLFVFGTVIAVQYPHDPCESWEHSIGADEVLYYNFAPIIKGGPGRNHRFIATKRYISIIDFLSDNDLPNPRNADLKEYDEVSDSFRDMLESRDATLIENVIEMDGIRIGIEVCFDHLRGVLWQNLQNSTTDEDAALVDVQLITSAGMTIEWGPNPIVPGGVVYLTDGGATSAACWRPSDDDEPFDPERVCRVPTPKGIKHFPPTTTGNYSSFFTISSCMDILDFPLLEGYYSKFQTQGCAMTLEDFGIGVMDKYKYYLPSIEFYPTVSLPGR